MTALELTKSIWNRRRPGELSIRITAKQVAFLQSLLHRMARDMPSSHSYTLPHDETLPPLTLVIYPNKAGFIKVENFACDYDYTTKRWFIKSQYLPK